MVFHCSNCNPKIDIEWVKLRQAWIYKAYWWQDRNRSSHGDIEDFVQSFNPRDTEMCFNSSNKDSVERERLSTSQQHRHSVRCILKDHRCLPSLEVRRTPLCSSSLACNSIYWSWPSLSGNLPLDFWVFLPSFFTSSCSTSWWCLFPKVMYVSDLWDFLSTLSVTHSFVAIKVQILPPSPSFYRCTVIFPTFHRMPPCLLLSGLNKNF